MSQTATPRIHRGMTIENILNLFPDKKKRLSQEISGAGLACVGCHAATWETLEGGMKGHGHGEVEIDRLVTRLNALLEEKEPVREQITLTERAAKKFLAVLEEDNKQGWALRFGDVAAGCSGFKYLLEESEKPTPKDRVFKTAYGVDIHVDEECLERLMGSEIDYVDGVKGSGFRISNPQQSSKCGCGSSHKY